MKFLLLVSIVGLSGCAVTTWSHTSKNEPEFHQDSFACENDAQRSFPLVQTNIDPRLDPFQKSSAAISAGSQNMGAALAQKNYYERCMASKGYYKSK
jgi:hypothetical protein